MFISHLLFWCCNCNPFSLIQKRHTFLFPLGKKKKKSTRDSNETIQPAATCPPVLVGLPRCYMLGTQSIQTSIVTVHHLTTIRRGCQGGLPTLPTVFGEVGKHKKWTKRVSSVPEEKGRKKRGKTGKLKCKFQMKVSWIGSCDTEWHTLVITRDTRINITVADDDDNAPKRWGPKTIVISGVNNITPISRVK